MRKLIRSVIGAALIAGAWVPWGNLGAGAAVWVLSAAGQERLADSATVGSHWIGGWFAWALFLIGLVLFVSSFWSEAVILVREKLLPLVIKDERDTYAMQAIIYLATGEWIKEGRRSDAATYRNLEAAGDIFCQGVLDRDLPLWGARAQARGHLLVKLSSKVMEGHIFDRQHLGDHSMGDWRGLPLIKAEDFGSCIVAYRDLWTSRAAIMRLARKLQRQEERRLNRLRQA